MFIIMLAGAMTVAMLVATVFALHQEAQRKDQPVTIRDTRPKFGPGRPR